jgi:predicted small secreted protein
MKKFLLLLMIMIMSFALAGCFYETTDGSDADIQNQFDLAERMAEQQPTPTDVEYSLERYNLIRRAYWVNGMRDVAMALQSPVPLPLGYIVLFSGPTIVAQFTVSGKVSSLNHFLTPDYISDYCYDIEHDGDNIGSSTASVCTVEMPDVDGTYGYNDDGIFFFTPAGYYIEWTGDYLYTDYFISIENPVVIYEGD